MISLAKLIPRKRDIQRREKRKREEGDDEEDTNEDEKPSINDREKVFMRSRTSKLHYQEIVKEMKYIRRIPPALIIPNMIDWILACEIRRSKSKNINGTVARQMREYLIKLYCAIGEIQKQKENTEAGKLKKEMEDMRRNMTALQEENMNLRRELELIKKKITVPVAAETLGTATVNKSSSKEVGKNRRKSISSGKGTINKKRNSQPTVTPLERKKRNITIRRELSYLLDAYNTSRTEEDEQGRDMNITQVMGNGKENLAKPNSERKRHKRIDSFEGSSKKNRDTGKPTENRKEQPDLCLK